jgi:hypothetical protein
MSLEGFEDVELEPDYRPKFGPGRPAKIIDYDLIERAASIGCTKEEISAVLGIGRTTLYAHMEKDPEIQAAIDLGTDKGKATLRRLQWKGAHDGNATMLIWLGKQYLGQKDRSELTGAADAPIRVLVELVGEAAPQRVEQSATRAGSRVSETARGAVQLIG